MKSKARENKTKTKRKKEEPKNNPGEQIDSMG